MLTILLGFSAVNTANNLLYIIASALLSFMAVSGFFGKNNLTRLDISVEFPSEVYAHKTAPIKVTLRNRRTLLPAFLIRVTAGKSDVLFPFLDCGKEMTKYVDIYCRERGAQVLPDIRLCSIFPFNFFVRYRELGRPYSYIVFPEPRRCELLHQPPTHQQDKGNQTTKKAGQEPDLLAVRDYIDGDPLKHINWKATAKTGRLKTKQFTAHLAQPVILDFLAVDRATVEDKLSCLTYLILRLLKDSAPVGLRCNGKFFPPNTSYSHKLSMLRELALYAKD